MPTNSINQNAKKNSNNKQRVFKFTLELATIRDIY